jgi:ribokinase
MSRPKIVVLGSMIYDCVTWGEKLPRLGETVFGYRNGFFTGGKGANQAVQAAKLGAEVYLIGRVGNDTAGDTLIKAIGNSGVNTDYVTIDDKSSTGTCCIHVASSGDNAIMVVPQANLNVCKEDIDKALPVIKDCDIFLSQLEVNLDAVVYALEKAYNLGVTVILNPAPAQKIPDSAFKYVDYATPNETETEFFTGIMPDASDIESCRRAAEALKEKGAKNVIFTLGAKGAYFNGEGKSFIAPPYKIKAVDVTAAGDAFNAGFVTMLGEGKTIEEAMDFANATGACAASKAGAQISFGDRNEIEKFMTDYKKNN